ncbi:hypothetical protein [Virgibacillus sediminis]|uniref:Uncharacterized protein n=1 Tax=Virgibacillus sediminis TaxID=202260 RepID=A0ABV7A1A8_9BACI
MSTALKLQEEELQTHEEAVQLANEINRLEAALKQMKSVLKSYVKEQGGIDTGEEVWDFYESVSWKFDRQHLKELAGEMAMEGIDPWEMLNIKLGTKKVTQRFTSRKK